ncbi:TetR/AcrR family transcriptional regulator [Kitasatospora sp. SUK 42]|uniref:TetR/AcrR family transcriptional regulator n=1 Tax=Kitasatospora sp. SUK 42 TaxID=1588882 RepID=UPI0018CAE886|nr:TetR/AcrR family transcriptional regulator [Kitasatospora sp. SUK 42]MBV2155045.1 TetR/AcrR family transcriptional regulator [Kitasatospora sp. SUK 42]
MPTPASPRPARTRNPRGEGGRLRDDIMAAATELLDESGESSVTLRSVARRAGVAAPSIYRHFPDQPSIMLAVVQQAFAMLDAELRTAMDAAGSDARGRLFAFCNAYLDFADQHPGRYRTMFGGAWMPDLGSSSVTEGDVSSLGAESLTLLADTLDDCVRAGCATSSDPVADAVALWLGLHGLAHQRLVTVAFPWPADIAERLITTLAHLNDA